MRKALYFQRFCTTMSGIFKCERYNTLVIVEIQGPFCWMDPTADVTLDELVKGVNKKKGCVGSFHAGGINVGMFDVTDQFISEAIDLKFFWALETCAGGESHVLP